MSLVDSAMTREVLRDISKRPLDISGLDVHVTHGVIYLRGTLDKVRGYDEDLNIGEELHLLIKLLRQKSGIRDIVCEVELAGPSVIEQMSSQTKRVA
ncbi:MAG: hypothetical protein ABFD49_00540 [Armatimonadota bacterium]|nr:hypothetical protein [bacterium]